MKITIKTYYFNTQDKEQAEQYQKLREKLLSRGLPFFNAISLRNEGSIPAGSYELEEDFIFSNQANAGNYRVFDWYEGIYPNRKIKQGHYIEAGKGYDYLKNLRDNKKACGYCGAQYFETKAEWCLKCLGSEYLKEKDLPLLALYRISEKRSYERSIPNELLTAYHAEQKKARIARLEKEKRDNLEHAKKEMERAEREYLAKKWLVDHGFEFSNMIYYSHTDTFCFGWRNSLEESEKSKLLKALAQFPYKFEIK